MAEGTKGEDQVYNIYIGIGALTKPGPSIIAPSTKGVIHVKESSTSKKSKRSDLTNIYAELY